MEAALILCSFLIKEKGRKEIPFGNGAIIIRYHAAV